MCNMDFSKMKPGRQPRTKPSTRVFFYICLKLICMIWLRTYQAPAFTISTYPSKKSRINQGRQKEIHCNLRAKLRWSKDKSIPTGYWINRNG